MYLTLDSQKTYRIFENLLINILKYSLEGTRVYIDVSDNEDIVTITMKNISKGELNFNPGDITERFVRGDVSRNTEGSGTCDRQKLCGTSERETYNRGKRRSVCCAD